jgi:hypothetical protein
MTVVASRIARTVGLLPGEAHPYFLDFAPDLARVGEAIGTGTATATDGAGANVTGTVLDGEPWVEGSKLWARVTIPAAAVKGTRYDILYTIATTSSPANTYKAILRVMVL